MHPYDAPRRFSGGPSATPIYDALYSEYVKAFRSLPGDRSGEEELDFTAFENIPHASGSYSAYGAGAYSARQQSQWQPVGRIGQQHTGMHHIPAALPPGPRRGN
ncbi:hypothetical protein [Streptomyces canus]|uniref:Uncharacterized protein n=1 Tax=Streptomyces canus TaxID=58343 RepID=A0AAW8FNX4_9ACTN|nr:hypothetical protein [Streptomyces canus]MDQ0759591.1 hypothetical protein [Streptomyces canus]MDQ0911796.1 hypothetical protein [Streptomyces canus]MDQ1071779.1 hypothetical protein [Streptomyces canus]